MVFGSLRCLLFYLRDLGAQRPVCLSPVLALAISCDSVLTIDSMCWRSSESPIRGWGTLYLCCSVQPRAEIPTGRCVFQLSGLLTSSIPPPHHLGSNSFLFLTATYRKHLNADRILMVFTNINICSVEAMLQETLKLHAKQMKARGKRGILRKGTAGWLCPL